MAIIRMTQNRELVDGQYVARREFPAGAHCPLENRQWHAHCGGVTFRNCVVLYETHHGLCLFESERNGYHDSDFLMTVWDPEAGRPRQIEFASTRGWSYPCYGSWADATDEVRAAYEKWRAETHRRERVLARWHRRREIREKAALCGLTTAQYRRLVDAVGQNHVHAYESLLKTKKFRSKFRKSLTQQVREWLDDPEPKYSRPLSPRQAAALRT